MPSKTLIQTVKYTIVGVMNTLITLVVIWLMLHFVFSVASNEKATTLQNSVSNIVGFACGLLNSFIFNRIWTFRSNNRWQSDFIRFMAAFLVCYILQLILLNILNNNIAITSIKIYNFALNFSFVCQIIGNVFYTILNFILNKYFTFKKTTH